MTTALTEYLTVTVASTASTADTLLENATTSATLTNKNTNLVSGTTGWVVIYPQGNGTGQTGAGSQSALDDICWLDDGTTLEGQHFIAGTWSFALGFETTTTGTFTADVHFRFFRRVSGGSSRVLIGEAVASSQTFVSTSYTVVTPSVSALASAQFGTGDKLGVKVDLNILANATTGNIRIQTANSSTLGNTSAQMVTPGYVATSTAQKKFASRLYQYAIAQKKFATRFYQFSRVQKTFKTRFFQYDFRHRWVTRFYQYVTTQKKWTTRFKQVGQVQHTFATRFGQYDANSTAQMLYDDLQQQYVRLRASSTNTHIQILALVYYTSSQILSEHALPGELDVLLSGGNIATDLHILKTIADVTAFIAANP